MLSLAELASLGQDPDLDADYAEVQRLLAKIRVGQQPELAEDVVERLHGFVELTVASAGALNGDAAARETVFMAANAALALSAAEGGEDPRLRLRTALLFELADKPMMAAAVAGALGGPRIVDEFFQRRGRFESLSAALESEESHNGVPAGRPLLGALGQRAWELAEYEQGARGDAASGRLEVLEEIALRYGLDLNASDVVAFGAASDARLHLATRAHVPGDLLDDLASGGFPPELWSGQATAIGNGLLDEAFDAWSFSAPTGTGKTFLARLLILATLRAHPERKVIYIVPSRALVRQVSEDLHKALNALGISVISVTPQLVALDDEENEHLEQAVAWTPVGG
jgi:hypothetical protein